MDVQFAGVGGFSLRGTLTLPAGDKPAPALLLIPGSGPTDRNGNQPPALVTDLLKQLAERLAREGVATLRFDKRATHVYAADWPKDPDALNRFFGWDRFTGDAKLAYLYLRGRPGIDPKRAGILGHSEGGIIALVVGAEMAASPDRPAALVLAGTPGRPLGDVVHNQVADTLTRQNASADQVKFFLDKTDSISSEVIRTGMVPADVPPGLAALYPIRTPALVPRPYGRAWAPCRRTWRSSRAQVTISSTSAPIPTASPVLWRPQPWTALVPG